MSLSNWRSVDFEKKIRLLYAADFTKKMESVGLLTPEDEICTIRKELADSTGHSLRWMVVWSGYFDEINALRFL